MPTTTTVNVSTSVVLIDTSQSNAPYYIDFPNISTVGRLITVRDNAGYASLLNGIVLRPIGGATFNTAGNIEIDQPFGFVTLTSADSGRYNILNTFAFPAGQAVANISNLNASNIAVTNTVTASTLTLQGELFLRDRVNTSVLNSLTSSNNNFYLNYSTILGNITTSNLNSTVIGLGSAGYISTIVPVAPITDQQYVAVGFTQSTLQSNYVAKGTIITGVTGELWADATFGPSQGFTGGGLDVASGNDLFVAVGSGFPTSPGTNYIQYSREGSNWSNATLSLTVNDVKQRVIYGADKYIATGYSNGLVGGTGTIICSPDGVTWTAAATGGFLGGYGTGLSYGLGVYVATGAQTGATLGQSIQWTTNGSNWNGASSTAWNSSSAWDVTFNGTQFIALVGRTPSNQRICLSGNGSNWSETGVTGAVFPIDSNNGGYIAANQNIVIVTSSNNAPSGQMMYYSLNGGYSWQVNSFWSTGQLSRPYWDGSQWWVGYYNPASPNDSSMWYSANGIAWTNAAQTNFVGGLMRGIALRRGALNFGPLLVSTVAGLQSSFTTQTFSANTISAGQIAVSSLTVTGAFTVSSISSLVSLSASTITMPNINIRGDSNQPISIGFNAGTVNQGSNAVAIGNRAATSNMSTQTIVINATGSALNTAGSNRTYVAPIRQNAFTTETGFVLGYTTSNEICQTSNNTISLSNGKVGINNTSPSYTLDVNGGINTPDVLISSLATSGNVFMQLKSQGTIQGYIYGGFNDESGPVFAGNYYPTGVGSSTIIVNASRGTAAVQAGGLSGLRFYTDTAGQSRAAPERMRISQTGFVGIGTQAPTYILDVNGTSNGSLVRFKSSIGTQEITINADLNGTLIDFNTSNNALFRQGVGTGTTSALAKDMFEFYAYPPPGSSARRVYQVSTSADVRFNSNVGFGAWPSSSNRVEVNGNLNVFGAASGSAGLGTAFINNSNGYFQGVNEPQYITNGSAPYPIAMTGTSTGMYVYRPATNNRDLFFRVMSNTSMITPLTVINNNRVGINTSNPSATLEVNGTAVIATSTLIGGTNTGSQQVMALIQPGVSPISGRLTFGTDGTGWQFRIGQNQANTITDHLTIQTGGAVGLGTTSPDYRLDVQASTDAVLRFRSTIGTDGNPQAITIGCDANSINLNILSSNNARFTHAVGNGVGGGYTKDMYEFYTYPAPSATPARLVYQVSTSADVRFNSNVGVKTFPASGITLDVNGTIRGSSTIVRVVNRRVGSGAGSISVASGASTHAISVSYTPVQSGNVSTLVFASVSANFNGGSGTDVYQAFLTPPNSGDSDYYSLALVGQAFSTEGSRTVTYPHNFQTTCGQSGTGTYRLTLSNSPGGGDALLVYNQTTLTIMELSQT